MMVRDTPGVGNAMLAPAAVKVYRFGVFELNPVSRQLLKNGREIHLQEQPLRVLLFLLERPCEVVTRENLRERLWPTETFIEFDDGLNTAVQKVRQVLGDDARNPRFVETVPRHGYRFIAPVRVDDGRPALPDAQPQPDAPPEPARQWRAPWIALAAAVAGIGTGWILPHRSASLPAPVRLSITPPAGVELRPGVRGGSAISPDGRTVAFVASHRGKTMLWVRALDSLDARELPGTEDALLPFWSPDSRSLGFVAGRRLRRIELAGGPPQDLAVASRPTRGAWSDDGTILFSPGGGGPLYRVPATGGPATPVPATSAGYAFWPHAIPGTGQFLYFNGTQESVALAGCTGTDRGRNLFAADSNAVYMPPHDGQPGYLFWMRGTALVGQVFDATTGKLSGDVLPIAEGVGFAGHSHFVDLSVSNTGVLLWGAGNTIQRHLAWLKRDGSLLENVGDSGWLRAVRLSPDGRRAVVEQGIKAGLWMRDFSRHVLTRLTFGQELNGWPAWSPDGRRIAYSGERGGRLGLWQKDSGGVTAEQKLADSPFDQYLYDWSRDGRYIAYCEVNPNTKIDVWILPLKDGRKPYPFLNAAFNEDSPQFSPDVRWLAYVSDETGRNEVYVTSFPQAGRKYQISTTGGSLARWSGDGRELFYIAPDGYLMSAPRKMGSPREWSAPRRLFALPPQVTSYDAAPHGDKFLVLLPDESFKSNELTALINWRR
jgi:Tol biopolymer transport system component/DNA-binding winged helix-turn-helix (wHTH) protein